MHYNWDLDLKDGEFGEQKIAKLLSGKMEVKTDFLSSKTGNVAVEIEYKSKPSGLSKTEAKHWIFVLYEEESYIIVPTEKLKKLIKNKPFIMGGDNKHSKLILVPKNELIN